MASRLAALAALLFSPLVIAAEKSALPQLRPGVAVEGDISGARPDRYALTLQAGQCARIAVAQRGIDLFVRVLGADGKILTEVDNEARTSGEETAIVVADTAADYEIDIAPRYPRAAAGRYAVTLGEIRMADEKDRALFEAMSLITKALTDGGRMDENRDRAARATELAEKALGPNDPYVGYLTGRLANLERTLGHADKAAQLYQRSIDILTAALGRDDPQTVISVDGLGLASIARNDYATAESLIKEGLASTERVLGPEHPRVVSRLMNLAIVYQDLGDKESAVTNLQRAMHICEKSFEPQTFQFMAVTNNLGTLYRELGDYDRAEPLLQRALHLVETRYGPEHHYVATPLQELGIMARERRDYDGSLGYLWRAEAAREKDLGLKHPQTIASLMVIANTYAAEGEYAKALDLQTRILEMVEPISGPYHNLTLLALANLARTYDSQGNVACALDYERRMDDVIEKNLELNLAIGSERQKLAYAETMSNRTDRTISMQVDDVPQDEAAAEHALLVLLQRKGRVLDAFSDNLVSVRRGMTAEDQSLLDRLGKTTEELASVALGGAGKATPAEYDARLKKLETEKESLEQRIGSRSAAFRAQVRPVTLAAVREAIPAGATLIELAVYRPYKARAATDAAEFGEPRYIAYVLRPHGPVRWRDLGSAKAIDDLVDRWRHALRDPQQHDVDALARRVDRQLMQPLQPLVGRAQRLIISPDGQLGLVPFEALVDGAGRYLVEQYSISYLSSGRDLLRMQVPRPVGTAPVLVADPFFGEPSHPLTMASAMNPRRSITIGDDFSTFYFGPLAGTREEARSIHALFPEARVLTGKAASKKALREVRAPRILHVATHGFFLENDRPDASPRSGTRAGRDKVTATNPLLRSGLALSGANLSSGSGDDGVLTALEASTLDLWGTELVTLSACDSGVGEVRNREGVYGLRRAFFLAGAESVVMSLWPVSDYYTRQMMAEYYSGLKRGLGRGEALRKAELSMLRRPGRRHPFYWASFIQSGDWTPLR